MKRKQSLRPVLSIVLFLMFFLSIFLLLQSKQTRLANEPLADPATLAKLINHEPIPVPAEEHYAQFHGSVVTPPALASLKQVSRVLGTASPSDRHIEVDLTNQRVYAFEGSRKIMDVPVSTGKWGPTPTGTFHIWVKLRSTLMSGGDPSNGTYYYLPNVPYVMFFSNDQVSASRGFSLHGTYWHHNFGHPMSHGCVNMRTEDAAVLFEWASPTVTDPKAWGTYASPTNPGTEIVIYGTPPAE